MSARARRTRLDPGSIEHYSRPPILGSCFDRKLPMTLLGKCAPARTHRPPLYRGLSAELMGRMKEIFAALALHGRRMPGLAPVACRLRALGPDSRAPTLGVECNIRSPPPPFLGSCFDRKPPMTLLGKCLLARTHRPPLIQGLIGRIDGQDEGNFCRPRSPRMADAPVRTTCLPHAPKHGQDGHGT
jgi:hypothetical protein